MVQRPRAFPHNKESIVHKNNGCQGQLMKQWDGGCIEALLHGVTKPCWLVLDEIINRCDIGGGRVKEIIQPINSCLQRRLHI